MKITILYSPDDINMMFTLYPLVRGPHARMFDFTCDPRKALRFSNKVIVVFKFWKYGTAAGGRPYLQRLRQRAERLIYFDDLADPRQVMTDDLDLFDLYFKKSLLVDRALYKNEYYAHRLYSDYYHRVHGVSDERPQVARALGDDEISKLRLAWNIGIGSYPKTRIRKALSIRLGTRGLARVMGLFLNDPLAYRAHVSKIPRVSARFRMLTQEKSVGFQREIFLRAAETRPDLFLTGTVPLDQYNRESRVVAATLSPFGWGEVCFRDFETIINRSILLKPRMDHVETFPDVYRPGETYVPVDWDGSNLVSTAEACVHDAGLRHRISLSAYEAYREGLKKTGSRVESFVSQILG